MDVTKLTQENITGMTARCINGAAPPCQTRCPFALEIRDFIGKCANGRWSSAYKVLRKSLVFPRLVSELCPRPCENGCVRDGRGGAINISGLERAAVDGTPDKERRAEFYALPQKAESAALIGAGPAGLSVALGLAQKKYRVTVFDAADGWGGKLCSHAKFAEFDREFADYFARAGVDFQFKRMIRRLDELSGFDAVFIATGRGGETFGIGADCDPDTFCISGTNVFLGGGLLGRDAVLAVADGRRTVLSIETFLQTGKPHFQAPIPDCGAQLSFPREDFDARVEPRAGHYYSEAEARAEAARCYKCDCERCMNGCELLRKYRKLPKKIAAGVYADTKANPPFSTRGMTREAYACSNCGYCDSVCPVSIDMGEVLRTSRRHRAKTGTDIPTLHDFWLREMDFNTTEGEFHTPGKCEYLFFPGCQLGAYNPMHVTRSLEALRTKFDIGVYLSCCGAPAYWAGEDGLLEQNCARLRAVWEEMGKPEMIFACATCEKLFNQLLPEISGVSLYKLLAELDVHAALPEGFSDCAVFDPCASRYDAEMRSSVRILARRSGAALTELDNPGKCCGYGGHMRLADPELFGEITEDRTSASGKPYIVYCANCRDVFSLRSKKSAHILDIALGVDPAAIPDIDGRRRNTFALKGELMETETGAQLMPDGNPWDNIRLRISGETAEKIDRKLIAQDDLREAIYGGAGRFADETGVCQCSLVRRNLTYWVTYRETDGEYEI
ncbi:MAG: NAD(P)-binding protein, partial [Oscillospiraceae bacterium]|nr:NAD(P)-binding protein [Oscillospiraceae bacterium]